MTDINGRPVIEARFTLPLCGFAAGHVLYGSEEDFTGAVTFSAGFSGSIVADVVRSKVVAQDGYVVLRCGNGLAQEGKARHYHQTNIRTVLEDFRLSSGVLLDDSAPKLTSRLEYWSRPVGPLCDGVDTLAKRMGASWRTTAENKLWFGPNNWPEDTKSEGLILSEDYTRLTVAPEGITLKPGTVWQGYRINCVRYEIDRDAPLRAILGIEP